MKDSCEYKTIVLITTAKKGLNVVNRLFERGVMMTDMHFARGFLPGGPLKRNGVPIETEQEIVTCVVEAEKADEVFALIYETAEVGARRGSFMYIHRIGRSTSLEFANAIPGKSN